MAQNFTTFTPLNAVPAFTTFTPLESIEPSVEDEEQKKREQAPLVTQKQEEFAPSLEAMSDPYAQLAAASVPPAVQQVRPAPPAAQQVQPAAPEKGVIQRIGDFFRPEFKSVLDTPATVDQQQQNRDRRLSYGAGPINQQTESAANLLRSGETGTQDQTVRRVAKAMQEQGQPTFADVAARAKKPEVVRAVRDAKADEFRSAGEWAADTLSSISQGTVGLVELPLNIFAPSSGLAKSLRATQKELQEQESDVLKAQRAQLLERVQNEDGFFGKYFATVESLITNPAMGLSEAVKQVPNFLSIVGAAKLGTALTGAAINTASRVSPTIALAEAISGNALLTGARAAGATAGGISAATLMTSGDAAGNVYQTLTDPKKTPMSVWRTNPDFQSLVAQGKTPKQAIEEISTAKARLAAAIVAPLGVLGFMGAEAAFVAQGGTRAAMQAATPKGAAKLFGKEIGLEQIQEGGTQAGANVASQTVNPEQSLLEGVPEAMATAAVTSVPFAGAAVARQMLQDQQAQVDPFVDAEARRRFDVQAYDPSIVDPASTRRPRETDPGKRLDQLLDERDGRIEPTLDDAALVNQPPRLEGDTAEQGDVPGMATEGDIADIDAPVPSLEFTPNTATPSNRVEYVAEVRRQLGNLQAGDVLENDVGDVWTVDDVIRNKAGEITGFLPREKNPETGKREVLDLDGVGSILMPSPYTDLGGNRKMSKPGRVNRGAAEAGPAVTPVTLGINPSTPPALPPPTKAAESLPETPTVPPAKTPKLFEPPVAGHAVADFPVVQVPVADLKLSKDVPQFKAGATDKGVVDPLTGKFTQEGVAPIAVWRRLDGSLEVISGRHRLDLAQRSKTKFINAQVYDEAQGFTAADASTLDAELNIRDEQGKVKDYVNYFKASGTDRETAESKGLLGRVKGKRGFAIANQGSDALIAAINGDQIGDEAAYYIAINAPNDERLQGVGLQSIMDGKSMQAATNMMQAVKAMAAERDTTTDMFDFDDSLMKEAREMEKIASKMQQSVASRLSAITGAAKNPAMAKAEGIDVRDPEAVKRRIAELKEVKAALENWSTNPEIVAEIRAQRGGAAPQFELRSETPQETVDRESTQDAERRAAEEKNQADNEVDFFQLQPQTQEKAEAPTEDMFAGEAGPSAEYQAAIETSNRAIAAFKKVQEAYRKQEIGDDDYLAARKVYDKAVEAFDKAIKKEQGQVEEQDQAAIDEQEAAAYEALQKQAEDEIDAGPIGQALQRIENGDFETKAQVRNFVNRLEKNGILDDVEEAREGLSDREQSADDVLDTVRSLLDDARDDAIQEKLDELESEQSQAAEIAKNEAEFIEESTKDKLEAIAQDFMVGDMVRFGSIPGTVVGIEGDYVRMRPDSATSPKAYQRVPKSSLTIVARPDNTSTMSFSREQDNKFGEEAGQLNANMGNLIQLLGANMYSSSLAEVTIKELLQNSFDAVKGAVANTNAKGEKIKSLYKTGKIEITIDQTNRTITIKDNARGMTPQIVRDAFFTVAGSDKSDLPPGQRSGGLGLAKMGFMLGAETLKLDTVRDGVRVTVDTTSANMGSNNFTIQKSPAPKDEHGTTVTVKIPEFYIDPKNGDERPIYFPYSQRSINALNQPLIGPVEVTFKDEYSEPVVLPVGVNFEDKKYSKFKANFDWGSADIFFGIERKPDRYSTNHKVLSAGVYQFSPDFMLDDEKIPYDIVVNISPNVDARHPDYPFVNSRENFKDRIKKDVEALQAYLGQIARGLEAKDLQESFKGVVSMPRMEAGQDIADISDKLKKTFDKKKPEAPSVIKELPKEVTVTADTVTDTKTQKVLVDVKAKEKQKDASFKGSTVPKSADFMLDLKQDPKLPAFHNNTNVDYLEIGRQYGEPEKFFAELGTLMVEMKEDLAKSGMYGYATLAPENLFFAGISIDKKYGGVHIKVPYKAVFINPFYSFGARTLFGTRQQQLNVMIHELAHTGSMDHGVAHNAQMIKVEQYLADEGLLDYYRDAILDILRRHESTFTAMKEAYDRSSTQNVAKSLEDYEKGSAAASSRGDTGGAGDAPSAVSARAGQGRSEGVSGTQEDDAQQDRGAAGEASGRPGNFLMNIEKPKKLPPGRTPELADAAKRLKAGEITKEDFDALVNKYRPIVTYTVPLQPATDDQVFNALDVAKRAKINPPIAAGYPVGLRLDIPAYNRAGVFVVSIHEKRTPSSPGKVIGYSSVASIRNATFGLGNQKEALEIATGKGKDAIQTMEGSFVPITPAEAFEKAKTAIKSPDYVQIGIDPTRHAYFFDRANTQPVVYAEEILQIGNMILGKGVKYGNKKDFLYNVEPSLAEQDPDDFIFGSAKIREEQIKEYAALRAKLARIPKQVAGGEADLSMQRAVARLMQQARDLNASIKATKPRRDSAEQFLAKAALEYDKGNISEEVFNVIKLAYDKMPDVLEGLLLSVKAGKGGVAGSFSSMMRIVSLYKESSGVSDPTTIRHELTHSLEQMMTPEQKLVVAQAWVKSLQAAIKKNPDEAHQKYFHAVMDFFDNPSEETYRKAVALLPSYDMYQFINPSEYWAVNAEGLMAAELGSSWDKFKRAVARLWEGMKSIIGFDNRYAVQKMFKDVMNGSRQRISTDVIADLMSGTKISRPKINMLENIDDDKKLVKKYNRPATPQMDPSPTKTVLVNGAKASKEYLKLAFEDPLDALGTAANAVDRGVMYARNKNVWFGSGLNAADFAKYNGQLKTSQGLATASVALDNAIRGGQIATEVIFQGGIKFDSKSLNFVATKKAKGMRGVYEAEAALKKRLGDQLGTDIIQGYLEAKRSRSIQNEFFERQAKLEVLKAEYEQLLQSGASEKDIKIARDDLADARKEFKDIEIVFNKINMSDSEIDEFIAREQVHPELRKIMDNWSAVNKNMLNFWRQVGLLSQKRYDALSNIQDYVPWQRIMNDETDIHSPVQATNRTMTNIGLERVFKKGTPTVITNFKAEKDQQVFKIQPAKVLTVEVDGKTIDPVDIQATPEGEVRLNVPIAKGDLVVFTASREIENIIDNMTRNVMRMTMNGMRQYAAQRIVSEYATRNANGKVMPFPKIDLEKGRFNFIVNGRKVVVEIQDPLIAESIIGMETLGIAMWPILAAAANITRRSITLSGVFQLKQVFKDAPTAALVTGVKNPLALIGGVYKGLVTSLVGLDPTINILKSAGIGGFQSAARTPEAEVKRRIGVMNRNVFDFMIKGLDHIGDSSDMAQRVATYKRVLAETGDEAQALYQAANVINFLHHGSGQVAQFVVKTVPFAGAYANATDVLFQAMAGGGLRGKKRSQNLATFAKTATLLSMITLMYLLMVGDDEEYNQLDDQTKLRNFMIPGTKIMLPMNTNAAFIFKVIPELIYNKVIKEGTDNAMDARRLRTALKEAAIDLFLGPTPVPSAAKPIIEIGLNRDFFTGRAVVPEAMAKLDAAERYTADTSELGKRLSSLTGTDEKRILDPIEADHIIRGIFGTTGAMVQWVSNSLGAAAGERVAPTDKQAPITGPFLRADVPRRNEALFYDFKKLVDNKYGTYSKMIERGDDDAADAYLDKHGDVVEFYKEVNKIDSKLKEINAEIRYMGEGKDTGMTPKERRAAIIELQREKQEVTEHIIEIRKDAGL